MDPVTLGMAKRSASLTFNRRNGIRPSGYGPQFQDAGVQLYAHADTGLASLYAPQLYDMAVDPGWDGPRWISVNSTDHDDVGGGLGGVCIMTRDADDPLGPFVSHRVGGNPVIYRDTTAGNQTEWPRFVYMPDDPDGKPHYMYYSQQGVGRGQSTLLAKTDDPLDPARYTRVGIVMQGAPTLSNGSSGPGDGQTTYADPFPWGESIGFVSIDGGGSLAGAKVLHRTDNGIRIQKNPRRIADRTDLTGDTELRFVYSSPFQWRGEWYATCMKQGWGSGLWLDTDARPYVAKISTDLYSIVSKPYPMLPGNVLPSGVTSVGLGVPISYADKIVVPYRANGRFGHIRAYIAEA